MKIEFSKTRYKTLVKALLLASWVVNSHETEKPDDESVDETFWVELIDRLAERDFINALGESQIRQNSPLCEKG
jgi:hypothetical protein